MTAPEYFKKVMCVNKELQDAGLDMFDLFNWAYLLDLYERTRSFSGIDFDIHHNLRKSVDDALRRKAKYLDEARKTALHNDMLRSRGLI